MLVPTIRYASRAIGLFSLIVVITAGLEVMENADVISKQREGLLRLMMAGTVTVVLAALTVRAPLSVTLRSVICVGLSLIMLGHFTSYTEQIPAWDHVPMLGRKAAHRDWVELLASGGWILAVVFIAFRAVRSLQQLHTESLRQERLRAIGEMTSGIAHDLNNALTPLVGSAELLMASIPVPSARQRRLGNLLEKAAVDVSAIVDRVSHFRSQGSSVQREIVSLDALVSEAFEGMQPILKAQAELDSVHVELIRDVDDVSVDVCPSEIRVLLTNLLLNAVQVMPEGGRVTVRNYYRGNQMMVEVVDTGCGMDREQLRRCREPFYTTKSSGSGLGLPTCRQIVEGYGSQLEIRSSPGRGTWVTFGLPVPGPEQAPPPESDDPAPIAAQRVLLVEDETEVRRTLRLMLKHLGLTVVDVACGQEAVQACRRQAVDLVITDFGLPDMTGAELICQLRQIGKQIPVIVLSGWGTESILARCEAQAEPDQVLKKPVSVTELRSALSTFTLEARQDTRLRA
ncbi:MAG: response regulator [Planctomycetaceae bacterium]|nr:response regulator [Planctomycetaceae bacterium]